MGLTEDNHRVQLGSCSGSMANTETPQTFADLIKRLDNSTMQGESTIDPAALMEILRHCKNEPANLEQLIEPRKKAWFKALRFEKRIEQFGPLTLVEMMRCFITFGIKPAHYDHLFLGEWERILVAKLHMGELRATLECYMDMPLDPPKPLVDRFSELGIQRSHLATNEDLAYILYAFGKFHIEPNAEFIQHWMDKSLANLNSFTADQIAMFIYGIGKLTLRISDEMRDALVANTHRLAREFTPRSYVMCLLGFARMRKIVDVKQLQSFMEHFYIEVTMNMDTLTMAQLARSLWSIATLKIELNQRLSGKWLEATVRNLHQANAGDLQLILQALLQLPRMDKSALVGKWMDRAELILNQFWPDPLAQMLLSLSHLNAQPSRKFLEIWIITVDKTIGPHMYTKDLIAIATGLANFDFNPLKVEENFMKHWSSAAEAKGHHFSQTQADEVEKDFDRLQITLEPRLLGILRAPI